MIAPATFNLQRDSSKSSLAIGITFLAISILLGDLAATASGGRQLGEVVRESLLIGGWVAMWRPLEVFLYDWWPIRAEAFLFDRLAAMPVCVRYTTTTSPDTWRAARLPMKSGA